MRSLQSKEDVIKMWQDAGLSPEVIDRIASLLLKRHMVKPVPVLEGTQWSRWGGNASLPADELPPESRFLLQIAIDELPQGPVREKLPATGALYFFMHHKGRDRGTVIWRAETFDLDTAAQGKTTPVALEARTEWICPEYESDEFDDLDLPADVGNLYMDWEEDFLGNADSRFLEGSVLLGGMTDDALNAGSRFFRREKEPWELLLSLDPTENKQTKQSALGDIPFLSQRIFFYIKPEDLEQHRFGGIVCRFGKG